MRHATRIAVLICLTLFHPSAPLVACLWDTETLMQERMAAPSVLEVIVGKFPRHSRAYYQWRLADRLKRLETDPANDRTLDDIAVSYEKLGDHDAAIEIATAQLSRAPGRYESLANMGTFLIHKGEWEAGMGYIAKAIEVNPDAHFGREEYQLLLVKYLAMLSQDGRYKLPLGSDRLSENDWSARYPFLRFVGSEKLGNGDHWIGEEERQQAIDAVLGMMRFSQHDNPVLLDVLGELLEADQRRRLAFRCYVSAGQQVTDGEAKRGYEELARRVISEQYNRGNVDQPVSQSEVMEQFRREQADAANWFAELARDETKWIAAGEDVDAKFNERYRNAPQALVTEEPYDEPSPGDRYVWDLIERILLATIFAALCIVAILTTIWFTIRRRRNGQGKDTAPTST